MNDLITRIKAEKWHMRLDYFPKINIFLCELSRDPKRGILARATVGRADTPESAIIDAIQEMDR